jgi:ketosteroid isomerase-like protein
VTDERVAMLRRGLEAWNNGDVEGMLELLEPDVGIHLSGAFPGLERDYRGHEGLRTFWREMNDMWHPLEMEAGEIEPLGDLLLSGVIFRATGRDGIRVERTFYFVWQFDRASGKVSAYSSHRDRESALEAARAATEKGGFPA